MVTIVKEKAASAMQLGRYGNVSKDILQFKYGHNHTCAPDDVAAQVELSRSDGNIWSLMFKGDLAAVRRILENDPSQASPEWNLLCSLRQECVQHYLCCALAVFI